MLHRCPCQAPRPKSIAMEMVLRTTVRQRLSSGSGVVWSPGALGCNRVLPKTHSEGNFLSFEYAPGQWEPYHRDQPQVLGTCYWQDAPRLSKSRFWSQCYSCTMVGSRRGAAGGQDHGNTTSTSPGRGAIPARTRARASQPKCQECIGDAS